MKGLIYPIVYLMLLATIGAVVVGCGDDSNKPAAQTAENALGVQPGDQKKTTETTRSVTIVEDKKVIDDATGKTISEEKKITPVAVTKETQVNTDVKVNVGETKKAP